MISINVYDDRREMKRHGTFAFPLAVYHYVMSDCMLGYINWHWHEEIQLNLVTHGAIRFYADGQQVLVRKGEGFFINSGRLHMARPEKDPSSSHLCLDFHPRLLSSFDGSVFGEKYVKPYLDQGGFSHLKLDKNIPGQEKILQHIREIGRLYEEEGFGFELMIQGRIGEMWLDLIGLRSGEASVLPERGHGAAQEIISYLRTNYQENISLDDVAKAVGFSTSECCRLFKKITGDTIVSYLRSYRLSRSVELLEETDLSVSQIAYESGFSGASYYIESFKRELNMTPLQYRREHRSLP